MEIYDEEVLAKVKENYKICDFTEMSYEEIFKALKNVLVEAFDVVTTYDIKSDEQVKFQRGETYVYEDRYGKFPVVDLFVNVEEEYYEYNGKFCLTITPFNCCLDNDKKKAGVYGWRDKEIKKVWRNFMKDKYGEAYVTMFKEYFENKKAIRNEDAKLHMEADIKYNETEYEKEISTII